MRGIRRVWPRFAVGLALALSLAAGACRKGGEAPPPTRPGPSAAADSGAAPKPAPLPAPDATPTSGAAAARVDATLPAAAADVPAADAARPRADASPEAGPAADGAAADARPAGPPEPEPFEVEAQVRVLRTARDVLEVFLTTPHARLRHALLDGPSRGSITAPGLRTFYAAVPGLLDLPLPLAPETYDVQPLPGDDPSVQRYEVRRSAPPDDRTRRAAYYALREEEGGWRVLWDRRDVAAARVRLAKGEFREAEAAARAVLARSPYCGDCEEIVFWAQSRREGGRPAWTKAGEHAQRAVELEPALAEHWNALGVYHRNVRQYGRAHQAFEKALALDPRSPAAGNLALLLQLENEDEAALKAIDAYVTREPGELWGQLTRCDVLRGLDRKEEAVAACEKAISLAQPADETAHVGDAHYLLAGLLRDLGRKDEALAQVEKALEVRPGYWMYVNLKEALQK